MFLSFFAVVKDRCESLIADPVYQHEAMEVKNVRTLWQRWTDIVIEKMELVALQSSWALLLLGMSQRITKRNINETLDTPF